MKPVKLLVLITISFALITTCRAQLKLPFNNPIQSDMEKVINDYPNHFSSLIGEELSSNFQSIDYRSLLIISGAEECSVTRYHGKKEIYSWQAVMLTTEDFESAKKRFKTLYGQLNNLTVNSNPALHFRGNYESPSEEKIFTSSIFSLEPPTGGQNNLKIELTMQYELMQWRIKILVYSKEREDNERGQTKEG
jgi:hypothetical protein